MGRRSRPAVPPAAFSNNHLGYAITWFGLAAGPDGLLWPDAETAAAPASDTGLRTEPGSRLTRVHTLSNGVRVVCDPMPGLETFALTVAVRGGARWEDEHRSGWSHLLEHLVFKGAGDMGAREIVERIEAEGGSINAATGYERTSFEVRALERLAAPGHAGDLGSGVPSDPEPREIDPRKGRGGPGDRRGLRHARRPCVRNGRQTQAFAGQPLGRPILGSVDSIGRATGRRIGDWRARLYAPDRMVVAVSGAVDEARAARLWPSAGSVWRPRSRRQEPEPAAFAGGDAALTRRIEQANLVFQLPGLSAHDADTTRRCGCSPRSWAAAWPRACSRARARSGAWPTPSTPIRGL